jgi:hypothetical protein
VLEYPSLLMDVAGDLGWHRARELPHKKLGAAGITTAAPNVASQWGRGDDRLSRQCRASGLVPAAVNFF